jgi:SAM-dependent methyltransferase
MVQVKNHYDEFLGPVYSWILGDFESAYKKNIALFASLNLQAAPGDVAIDLGAGPGCQSIPLAELGFEVVAVDFCQDLLDEIAQHAGHESIRTVCADIVEFAEKLERGARLIVCMGDTLVHLPGTGEVSKLLSAVSAALAPSGTFIYSIRDYSGPEPQGRDRFIPIRASEEQIFTCFLDYGKESVHVHDILHKKVNGVWTMRVSDYFKLRLSVAEVNDELRRNGLEILSEENRDGMLVVAACKRP